MTGIPSYAITDEVWDIVRRPLRAALARSDGKYHMGDLYRRLKRADWQLWVSTRSVAVTAVEQWSRTRRLVILFASGELTDMLPALPTLMAWGRSKGCEAVEVHGRPGWWRALGWERVDTVARAWL